MVFNMTIKPNSMVQKIALLLSGYIGLIELEEVIQHHPAFAHNFVSDDFSTFLALVYRTGVELSLTNSNFPLNITLALEHAENTAELMDDLLYLDDSRDDTDFIKKYDQAMNSRNVTSNALVLANILDQVLIEYGEAYDIDYDPTNMSNMIMTTGSETFVLSSSPSPSSNISMHKQTADKLPMLSNVANYQSSQRLSATAYDIFTNALLQLPAQDTNNKTFESKVEKSLLALMDLINNNATVQDLMMLIHEQTHPNLQLTYNLTLKQ
jgi:hypothetical protein